jgi:hypothetical protein
MKGKQTNIVIFSNTDGEKSKVGDWEKLKVGDGEFSVLVTALVIYRYNNG